MAACHSPESFEISSTTQRLSDVGRQSAHIGSTRTSHFEFELCIRHFVYPQSIDFHVPWLARDFFALPGQTIQTNTMFLKSGKHRRHLLQLTSEFFFQASQLSFADRRYRSLSHDLSCNVLRIGFDAEDHGPAVAFCRAEKDIGDLCSFV